MKYFITLVLCAIMHTLHAQNNIGIGTTTPDPSAVLDISSIDKGVLIPRMGTFQRESMGGVALGLLVFDVETESFWFMGSDGWKELRKGNITSLEDSDGDTSIQVEESPDEDVIRFDVDSTEVFRIRKNASGRTMLELPDSGGNSFLGRLAGDKNTTGTDNTYMGSLAGFLNSTGNSNVFVGFQAGRNSSGTQSVYIGREAGHSAFGDANVFIGNRAGYSELGSHKLYIANSNTSSPLIYGEFDNSWLKVNGRLTPTEGITDADGDTRIQVEESNDEDVIRFDLAGDEVLKISKNAAGKAMLEYTGTGNNSTFLGRNAGQLTSTSVANAFLGADAGQNTTTGHSNTFVGYRAGRGNIIGENNICIGREAGLFANGDENVFIGRDAGRSAITGHANVFVGRNAGRNNGDGGFNVILGSGAGYDNTDGSSNVFIGADAGGSNTGDGNVFIGDYAGYYETTSNKLYIENSDSESPLIYGELIMISSQLMATLVLEPNLLPKARSRSMVSIRRFWTSAT